MNTCENGSCAKQLKNPFDDLGTGQAPIKVSTTAERMFNTVLDYMNKMREVDSLRMIISGVIFGGCWEEKLAFTKKD